MITCCMIVLTILDGVISREQISINIISMWLAVACIIWLANLLIGRAIVKWCLRCERMYQMTKRKSERYAGPVRVACIYIVINMGQHC